MVKRRSSELVKESIETQLLEKEKTLRSDLVWYSDHVSKLGIAAREGEALDILEAQLNKMIGIIKEMKDLVKSYKKSLNQD